VFFNINRAGRNTSLNVKLFWPSNAPSLPIRNLISYEKRPNPFLYMPEKVCQEARVESSLLDRPFSKQKVKSKRPCTPLLAKGKYRFGSTNVNEKTLSVVPVKPPLPPYRAFGVRQRLSAMRCNKCKWLMLMGNEICNSLRMQLAVHGDSWQHKKYNCEAKTIQVGARRLRYPET